MKTFPLFTLNPTPAHWLLWAILVGLAVLAVWTTGMVLAKWKREYRQLREFEDGRHRYRERNRLAPARPRPTKDRDALASEYRERGGL